MQKRMILYIGSFLILLVGCTVDQMGKGELWLARPASTQPGSATNEQVIRGTTEVVGSVAGPYGTLIAVLANTGLILYHDYAARQRAKITNLKIDGTEGASVASGEGLGK